MEQLKRLRLANKMTLQQLGAMIGKTAISVSRYENGHRKPDITTLLKLSDIFGVTVDKLIKSDNNDR